MKNLLNRKFNGEKFETEYSGWLTNPERVVLMAQSGSYQYNLQRETSDTDYYVVVMPPKEYHLGFKKFETFVESSSGELTKNTKDDYDFTFKALHTFVKNALGGSAMPLELLFAEESMLLHVSEEMKVLRANRHLFLNKNLLLSFLGAENKLESSLLKKSQLSEMENLKNSYEYDFKKACNHLRFCEYLEQLFTTETFNPYVTGEKQKFLMSVKNGEYTYGEVSKLLRSRYNELVELQKASTLPEKANSSEVNKLLTELQFQLLMKLQ